MKDLLSGFHTHKTSGARRSLTEARRYYSVHELPTTGEGEKERGKRGGGKEGEGKRKKKRREGEREGRKWREEGERREKKEKERGRSSIDMSNNDVGKESAQNLRSKNTLLGAGRRALRAEQSVELRELNRRQSPCTFGEGFRLPPGARFGAGRGLGISSLRLGDCSRKKKAKKVNLFFVGIPSSCLGDCKRKEGPGRGIEAGEGGEFNFSLFRAFALSLALIRARGNRPAAGVGGKNYNIITIFYNQNNNNMQETCCRCRQG